ncbi:hypothetical protein V8C86DRAFT_3145089, partial [Haematococcus lacustris]
MQQPGSHTASSLKARAQHSPASPAQQAHKAGQAAEPTQPTKGEAQGKAAKAKPAPQPGRWLDRNCNAALDMQRIGESQWRPLELCGWPEQGKLPAKGKEYPGLGYKREFIAFLVDVGESMHSHLPAVSQFLFRTMEAKLLHKPSHEIAVVLYGSDVTRNEPHDEAAARGDQEQNMNVQVLRGLCVPDLEGMKALRQLEPGHGQVDILDSLTVVLDLFVKADQARCLGRSVVKRCVLISNLRAQSSDFDVEYAGALVDKFQDHGVGLEVLVLDFPHDTPLPSASTTAAADAAPTPGAGAAAGAGGGVPAGQGGSEE